MCCRRHVVWITTTQFQPHTHKLWRTCMCVYLCLFVWVFAIGVYMSGYMRRHAMTMCELHFLYLCRVRNVCHRVVKSERTSTADIRLCSTRHWFWLLTAHRRVCATEAMCARLSVHAWNDVGWSGRSVGLPYHGARLCFNMSEVGDARTHTHGHMEGGQCIWIYI